MLNSLYSGLSGIQQFQNRLDVIGNNIANSNTVAYKSATADSADAFSETLQASSAGTAAASGTGAMQIGAGVTTGSIRSNFTGGSLTTGIQTDLAVKGNGFFIVHDPVTGGEFATRAGDFKLDNNGYLVTNKGLRVQGFLDNGLSTRGDIKIDAAGAPAGSTATYAGYNVDLQGKIHVALSDGTTFVRGQVLLQSYRDPQALLKQGDNLYSGLTAAGPDSTTTEAPGSNGLGDVVGGQLETSNVDLAKEFADLITTQRGFQASARMITTSDEILQEVVGLKR
jgi:flagellar hook protein FlgE